MYIRTRVQQPFLIIWRHGDAVSFSQGPFGKAGTILRGGKVWTELLSGPGTLQDGVMCVPLRGAADLGKEWHQSLGEIDWETLIR